MTSSSTERTGESQQRTGGAPVIGAAPGPLETVRAFVNTLDIDEGTDELRTPAELSNWLSSHGPTAERATDADLRRAIEVRETLRAILRAHASATHPDRENSTGRPAADLRAIADGQVRVAEGGATPAAGLARILLIAAEASTTGTWPRLKICSADDCQWAFYDRSPTKSACWCSMAGCGSRAKSRAYRQRAAARLR